jgi:hypothetical protein
MRDLNQNDYGNENGIKGNKCHLLLYFRASNLPAAKPLNYSFKMVTFGDRDEIHTNVPVVSFVAALNI